MESLFERTNEKDLHRYLFVIRMENIRSNGSPSLKVFATSLLTFPGSERFTVEHQEEVSS